MNGSEIRAFVAIVSDIVRRAAASGPLPRGWSHLGLDHPTATSLDHLSNLARQGIFRKYEQVLFLEDGLGAGARWAAALLGCQAIAVTARRDYAIHGRVMTRAAGLAGAVTGLVGSGERLPMRAAAMTHVWAMESMGRLDDPAATMAEAQRVVRPGGQFAMVELVTMDGSLEVAGRRLRPATSWVDQIRGAGFVDVAVSVVDEVPDGGSARVGAAREQLHARLATSKEAALRRVAADSIALTSARESCGLRVARIAARRP